VTRAATQPPGCQKGWLLLPVPALAYLTVLACRYQGGQGGPQRGCRWDFPGETWPMQCIGKTPVTVNAF